MSSSMRDAIAQPSDATAKIVTPSAYIRLRP